MGFLFLWIQRPNHYSIWYMNETLPSGGRNWADEVREVVETETT